MNSAVPVKGQRRIDPATLHLLWRGVVGLALFALALAALSIKANGQTKSLDKAANEPLQVPKAVNESGVETETKVQPENTSASSATDMATPQATPEPSPQTQTADSKWHYGGFVDVGYLLDFNHPENK